MSSILSTEPRAGLDPSRSSGARASAAVRRLSSPMTCRGCTARGPGVEPRIDRLPGLALRVSQGVMNPNWCEVDVVHS